MKKSRVAAAVASAVLIVGALSTAGGAYAESSVLSQSYSPAGRVVAHGHVLSLLQAQYGNDLVVVGPVEFVSGADGILRIVGQTVSAGAIDGIAVGDYVAVLGLPHGGGRVDADDVLRLADRYVPALGPCGSPPASSEGGSTVSHGDRSPAVHRPVHPLLERLFARGPVLAPPATDGLGRTLDLRFGVALLSANNGDAPLLHRPGSHAEPPPPAIPDVARSRTGAFRGGRSLAALVAQTAGWYRGPVSPEIVDLRDAERRLSDLVSSTHERVVLFSRFGTSGALAISGCKVVHPDDFGHLTASSKLPTSEDIPVVLWTATCPTEEERRFLETHNAESVATLKLSRLWRVAVRGTKF